jgi:peptide/nickel transport system permease protein
VAAARLAGNSHPRIVLRHLLPNTLAPLLAIASLNVGWAILTTAGLSFLGIGVQPPTPEWGQMIASGMTDLGTGVWWTSLFPGAALFVFVLGCNLLGDGVQRLLDPQAG